ncbi:TBC1 domain family member 30-like isoform X1 [Mya arenaria]|uniref:TBC1 domain family member 30-like isoform X1 n=2 Tax=Mya arenaria TaxID=6604 RepID=UPI0022E92221|nr:TBC1 domain family member 30-like isoform X1 [Mya arenaria]
MSEEPILSHLFPIESPQILFHQNKPPLALPGERPPFESQSSIVDGLLSEIYDRWHDHRHDSFDSDTFTEYSSTAEFASWRRASGSVEIGGRLLGSLNRANLKDYGAVQLRKLISDMTRQVNQISAKLVRQLKRRERRMSKLQNNCDIVTAFIQASSPKRRIDTRMRFSLSPQAGDSAFDQWKDAMRAVARLPLGIPVEFRRKVWLSLADQYISELKINWDRTVKFAFNERSNPDDNTLGMQIVKDLHRTGCSGFSGEDNEAERAVLKRILLAYARWNKAVGYCQGFNVIAALLLDVMDRKEADALKVMIFLIDKVLPEGYFAHNLRALSVDMAVFRDLLKIFPKLSRHLDYLQHAQDQSTGGCYEPPLTNVFTMQWFLTLFATCLPKSTVLRVWDCVLLDGSEILLRTALVIWGKLSSRILQVGSADEFYTLMGDITQEMVEGNLLDADAMIKSVYLIAPFPLQQLTELREKYTYNIRPFTPATKARSTTGAEGVVLPSDEDDLDEEDIEKITCFTGFIPTGVSSGGRHRGLDGDQRTSSIPDISSLGPGAYGPSDGSASVPAYMERMSTDISALKKQYSKLTQRQNQAHVILNTATARQQATRAKPMMPMIETPVAMNHLFVTKQDRKGRNRCVAAGPRIASVYPNLTPLALIPGLAKKNVQPAKWAQKSPIRQKIDRGTPSPTASAADTDTDKAGKDELDIEKVSADVSTNNPDEDAIKKKTHESGTNDTKECDSNASEDNTDKANVKDIPNLDEENVNNNSATNVEPNDTKGAHNEEDESHDEISLTTAVGVNLDIKSDFKEIGESDVELDEISRYNFKGTASPFRHSDSGLGTSIYSSSLSASSAETSPQHVCVERGKSVDLEVELKSVSEETLSFCEDISHSWGADAKTIPGNLTDADARSDNIVKNLSSHGENAECNNKVVDGADDNVGAFEISETDEVAIENLMFDETDISLDGSLEFSEHCASDKGEIHERTDEERAMTYATLRKDDDVKCEHSPADVISDIAAKSESLSENSDVIVNQEIRVTADSNGGEICSVCPVTLSSDLTLGSTILQNPYLSTPPDDSLRIPEVFNPASKADLTFQQYYMTKRSLGPSNLHSIEPQMKTVKMPKKSFNPFPTKHVNQNRAKTGLKLGLYKQSTLDQFERNLKGQSIIGK